eukprot:TRINITY_DN830_c0_g9_i1.p1 TRINITY_DN830_c0_g9~~TRINITY_DN830_c0_g9_i1.p1  ORF type:complete len:1306 (+),score=216.55 TRINITY_DN830_c0_g9_i1:618-4535(+)
MAEGEPPDRFVDYFAVCGLDTELVTSRNERGFQGGRGTRYIPSVLDKYPQEKHRHFELPLHLSMTVLPGGLQFYDRGPSQDDESSHPRSYPVILTSESAQRIYVSVVAFRDPVDEDVAKAFSIPPNSYVDKCICLVSHWPFLNTFREALEAIHRMCFSPGGCARPLWKTIAHLVTAVPLPRPGGCQVLFPVENSLLAMAPLPDPRRNLPYTEISFLPLIQCLDVDNLIRLFTAVALEKRVLLQASKYVLLTTVAEAVRNLIYPLKWMSPYIPVVPMRLLDLFDAPGSFFFGLCTTLADVSQYDLYGVVVVDLDRNRVHWATDNGGEDKDENKDEIPELPEPEGGQVRAALLTLIRPELERMDLARTEGHGAFDEFRHKIRKPWGSWHDNQLRLIFLQFFVSILHGFRAFVDRGQDPSTGRTMVLFNTQAFIRRRIQSRPRASSHVPSTPRHSQTPEEDGPDLSFMVSLFTTSSWSSFLESGPGASGLFDTVYSSYQPGHPLKISSQKASLEIINVSEPPQADGEGAAVGTASRHRYDRFPRLERTPEQIAERVEKLREMEATIKRPNRSGTVASARVEDEMRRTLLDGSGTFNGRQRAVMEKEREAMVRDIKRRISQLWSAFLASRLEEGISEQKDYVTIHAMIDNDAEGVAGIVFMDGILENISNGWDCELSAGHFNAIRELILVVGSRASTRSNGLHTVLKALEVAAKVHKKDASGVKDYVQRHIGSLPVWQDFRFWDFYFSTRMERHVLRERNHADTVLEELIAVAHHMAELGLLDADAWGLLEALANRELISMTKQIRVRGQLAHMQQTLKWYFGVHPASPQGTVWRNQIAGKSESPQPGGTPGGRQDNVSGGTFGRNLLSAWMGNQVQAESKRVRGARSTTWGGPEIGIDTDIRGETPAARPGSRAASTPRSAAGVRVLRGHRAAITALHAGTMSELGDLLKEGDDVGYFVSGSYDKTVKLWDPSIRGNELRFTMEGHRGAVRAVSSDRTHIISGGDDHRVLIFEKATGRLMSEVLGHTAPITCVRVGHGIGKGTVLTAAQDGLVNMCDTRTDQSPTTVVRLNCPVLCLDYLDHSYLLAAAGTDGVCRVWDARAGKERFELRGHTGWIRTMRMVGDVLVTGSDDWTARVWKLQDGQCEAVLACHGGPITTVECSQGAKGIITGSADHTVRLWDRADGTLRCVETVGLHNGPILSVKVGERWLAIGAADNSMSLYYRQESGSEGPPERNASSGSAAYAAAGGALRGTTPGGQQQGMASWHLLRHMQRVPDLIRQVACDVDRGRICTGSRSGVLRVWEPPPP